MAQQERIHLPRQKKRVQSLGWEDPLEKEMATHSSILAWEIPWTEEPGGLPSMRSGHKRVRHDLETKTSNKLMKVLLSNPCAVARLRLSRS